MCACYECHAFVVCFRKKKTLKYKVCVSNFVASASP